MQSSSSTGKRTMRVGLRADSSPSESEVVSSKLAPASWLLLVRDVTRESIETCYTVIVKLDCIDRVTLQHLQDVSSNWPRDWRSTFVVKRLTILWFEVQFEVLPTCIHNIPSIISLIFSRVCVVPGPLHFFNGRRQAGLSPGGPQIRRAKPEVTSLLLSQRVLRMIREFL